MTKKIVELASRKGNQIAFANNVNENVSNHNPLKIECDNQTKIYIYCPANYASGGPELLHQLAFHLQTLGINANIWYHSFKKKGSPIHPKFKKYLSDNYVTSINDIKDDPKTIIIFPEVTTNMVDILPSSKKIVWWLSVDNHIELFFYRKNKGDFYNPEVLHFYQSEYAKRYLLNIGISPDRIHRLSDYINDRFLHSITDTNNYVRQNLVFYNPKRGISLTKKIIRITQKKRRDIQFTPIQNMDMDQMINAFHQGKVYLDFGNHPGKDRLPRETAVFGLCILVRKVGAARTFEDMPIPEEYKFADCFDQPSLNKISDKIIELIDEFEHHQAKFKDYRNFILSEKDTFINDIKNIFVRR